MIMKIGRPVSEYRRTIQYLFGEPILLFGSKMILYLISMKDDRDLQGFPSSMPYPTCLSPAAGDAADSYQYSN